MATMGRLDKRQFEEFKKQMETLNQADKDEFLEACTKELAARLLAKVIKRTPVGQYPKGSGKTGGTLRRGWTAGKTQNAAAYANSLPIRKEGNDYVIEIYNPVEYAPYVEFGHRTANHKGWVDGYFMMTISASELSRQAPQILEKRILAFLQEHMG